jgi:hypothetical protein
MIKTASIATSVMTLFPGVFLLEWSMNHWSEQLGRRHRRRVKVKADNRDYAR